MTMKYQRLALYSCVTLLSLIAGCDTYEFPKSVYPRVQTLPVGDISASGATLYANLTYQGAKPIHNHGFIWGTKPSLIPAQSVKISLGALGSAGPFDYFLFTGHVKDSVYYVRAFAEAETYAVFGELISFKSEGASAPIISSIEPAVGAGGDTIRVNGSGLSYLPSKIIVKFGTSHYGTTITSSDSSLQVIVPLFGTPGVSVTVAVTIAGQTSSAPVLFTWK